MLCRRSASLMMMTRMSLAIAMNILRRFSTCASSFDWYGMRVSLVTPSTSARDLLAELLGDLFARDDGIFDDVVQQRGGDRLTVHLQIGQDAGDGERMLDIRLARGPPLPLVGPVGQLVDARQPCAVERGIVGRTRAMRSAMVIAVSRYSTPEALSAPSVSCSPAAAHGVGASGRARRRHVLGRQGVPEIQIVAILPARQHDHPQVDFAVGAVHLVDVAVGVLPGNPRRRTGRRSRVEISAPSGAMWLGNVSAIFASVSFGEQLGRIEILVDRSDLPRRGTAGGRAW